MDDYQYDTHSPVCAWSSFIKIANPLSLLWGWHSHLYLRSFQYNNCALLPAFGQPTLDPISPEGINPTANNSECILAFTNTASLQTEKTLYMK